MIQILYKAVLRPLLFRLDAETAHNTALKLMRQLEKTPKLIDLITPSFEVKDERLQVNVRSLVCRNPVGLAAGFDKNAELVNIIPALGFGFMEVGTFTPVKQEGHKRPRLFRVPTDEALINRMGFNNPGVKVAAERLARRWSSSKRIVLGVNIGKGRDTPLEEAAEDYMTALEHVLPAADYIVLNVSSPNTAQLRHLQESTALEEILKRVIARVRKWGEEHGDAPKPIFTKVSPDCSEEQLDDIAKLSVELGTGIIATNTTTDFSILKQKNRTTEGGVSGAPLRTKSNAVIQKLYRLTRGIVPIIGVGGIFSAQDAYEKIRSGASLIQIYTGWVYQGPGLVPEINKGLLSLIQRDGFKRIQDAVGSAR